jgi:hypothetical protein
MPTHIKKVKIFVEFLLNHYRYAFLRFLKKNFRYFVNYFTFLFLFYRFKYETKFEFNCFVNETITLFVSYSKRC